MAEESDAVLQQIIQVKPPENGKFSLTFSYLI